MNVNAGNGKDDTEDEDDDDAAEVNDKVQEYPRVVIANGLLADGHLSNPFDMNLCSPGSFYHMDIHNKNETA